jgi:hypothetical protein
MSSFRASAKKPQEELEKGMSGLPLREERKIDNL